MINISVIIPNYNHAAYLPQRINSVLQQTYINFEVIILDDCSSDDSRLIIETYKNHDKISNIFYNETNSGSPFRQWKKGIETAKSDWIWIAESDDFADRSFLEEASRAIQQFSDLGIFYCDSFIVDETGSHMSEKFSERKNLGFSTEKWNKSYYNQGIDEINEFLKFDCTINNVSSMVFKKTLFTNNPKQLDSFEYYGDWAFVIKACLFTNVYYSSKPLNYYRKHPASYLHGETSVLIEKYEHFNILKLLYYGENVTEKERIADHFAYNYLSFGLIKDGIKKGIQFIRSYFKTDKRLALKITIKIAGIILFRKKRPFFVPKVTTK